MAKLVYRKPCEHGHASPTDYVPKWDAWIPCGAHLFTELQCHAGDNHCPGGSEVVLDPDTVLIEHTSTDEFLIHQLTVADVLAALDGADE